VRMAQRDHDQAFTELLLLARNEENWASARVQQTIVLAQAILERIDAKLEPLTTRAGSDEEQVSRLRDLSDWISRCGGEDSAFTYARHENAVYGNCVKASRDIEEGDIVMRIPRKAMLSASFGLGRHPAIASSLLPHFVDNNVLELAIVVAFHKLNIETSFFRPYLEIMPDSFNLPLFWGSDMFVLIQATPTCVRAARSFRAALVLFYRAFKTIETANISAFPASRMSWSLFRWAFGVVLTRQNNVPLPSGGASVFHPPTDGTDVVPALVPGWDMMNHATGAMTTRFELESDCLVYPSMAKCAAGEELCMCYGLRQNELFVLFSGFCVRDSPFDSLELALPLPQDDIVKIRELLVKNHAEVERNQASGGEVFLSVSVRRNEGGVLSPAAWMSALGCVVDRTEAAAILRSRLSSFQEIVAAGLVGEQTQNKARDVLKTAVRDYLAPLETALVAVTDASKTEEGKTKLAALAAFQNLFSGQVEILQMISLSSVVLPEE